MGRDALRFRIGGPAAASLLVNALLVAALLNLGMGRPSPRIDSSALTVMSLAALKGEETGVEETEARASAPASPSTPVESPPEPLRPAEVAPVMPPMIAPPSSLAAPRQAPIAATAGAASPSPASTARKGTADGLDVKAPPGVSRSYAAKVRSWLYAHKTYPRRARMRREEGCVQVRFVLDRAGMLVEGVIVRGSGHPTLDEEATAMMRRASPFPRVPVDLPGDHIEFTAPIEFILPA